MTAATKPPTLFLRLRTYPEGKFVTAWLCRRNPGGTTAGLLSGELLPGVAEHLAEVLAALGLPVERETCPMPDLKPVARRGCATAGEQGELFGGE